MVYRWEGGNQVMEWEDLTLRDDLIVGDDLAVGWDVTITGSLSVAGSPVTTGWVILAAGDNLVGSATSDILINTDKFTVAGATGNTLVAGTLNVTGDTKVNTDKFTVAASTGNTVVAGTLNVTGKVTADDVDLASGAVVAWVGTWANGIKLKNLKNSAATALSGTQLDIEIDIGGTPYYFTVYPTKA